MELHAAGLNAWGQLRFEKLEANEEPDDISTFTCVLSDDKIIHVRPFFSYTVVDTKTSGLLSAGLVPKERLALRTAMTKTTYSHFAEASNGIVVVHDGDQSVTQHPSLPSLLSNNPPSHTFPNFPNITQLVSFDTGFAALSSTGAVYTWGDERYAACLGREPTSESPASTPSLVSDLTNLPTGPITKLSAGGYLVAALTAGNDLYCWGHPGRTPASILSEVPMTESASPVVIDEFDIADVAVGEAHLVALTTTGEVFVLGDNSNGQLGLGPQVTAAAGWTRVSIGVDKELSGKGLSETKVVVGVAAGPRNSFLIVQNQT
ncbi:regulator of chromosome condensation 1/beta-lactamase-inhibitor protein II [Lasiosphaeria hispida]|uniref:Regulator of chromosome condensation 1/beta-lactamase-inhibitor protein II n=1 Tax=Lasiosphaeria hispida TaxID=260671 RepID=A0AAJ0M9Q6_9PEZI|nr:regulator of chromosome condensation 1/beta-lactamase-inhibitor protein II [Lasiosphaeria hispida]